MPSIIDNNNYYQMLSEIPNFFGCYVVTVT